LDIAHPSIHDQLSELRRQRTDINGRIAELEAEAARQSSTLQPGDYVKITSASIAEGEYARYVRYDSYGFQPHEVVLIPSNVGANAMSVEPATAAEAAEYLRKVADSLT